MTLTPVDDLYPIWPWVRQGLQKAIDKTAERYRPEDVWLMLQTRAATLYVFATDQPFGFVVAQKQLDPDGPVLFIYAAWGVRPDDAACYAELEKLGAQIKAKRLRMWSPRGAWRGDPYWTARTTVYEHELESPC